MTKTWSRSPSSGRSRRRRNHDVVSSSMLWLFSTRRAIEIATTVACLLYLGSSLFCMWDQLYTVSRVNHPAAISATAATTTLMDLFWFPPGASRVTVAANPSSHNNDKKVALTMTTTTTTTTRQEDHRHYHRALSLRDFQIDEFYDSGSVNDVCLVRLVDPNLATAYGLGDNQTIVLKLVYNKHFGHAEITSFERFAAIDDATAERLHLPRPVWMQRNAINPYYCSHAESTWDTQAQDDDDDQNNDYQLPWDDYKDCVVQEKSLRLPKAIRRAKDVERFRASKYLDIIALPFLEEHFIHQTAVDITSVKIFFQSILQVLQMAHELGVNNIDLQVDRNIYVNTTTGRAILFDWNALIEVGQKTYDKGQNNRYAPPEAWIENNWGIPVYNTNMHAMDIWQVGIGWASTLYYPCKWESAGRLNKRKSWLAKVIMTLGGNTVIPIDTHNNTLDLALLHGVAPQLDQLRRLAGNKNKEFVPLLYHKRGRCEEPSWFLDDPTVPQAEKDLAVDFLRKMLVLSPAERPTATQLLQHAIFDNLPATATTTTTTTMQ